MFPVDTPALHSVPLKAYILFFNPNVYKMSVNRCYRPQITFSPDKIVW